MVFSRDGNRRGPDSTARPATGQGAGSVSDDRRSGLVRYLPEVNKVVFVVDMVPEFLGLYTFLDADCEKA
jgi:hypothetical protein